MREQCPVCGTAKSEVMFHRNFEEAQLLTPFRSYDVLCCPKCGMVYAGNIEETMPLARYYDEMSKYDGDFYVNVLEQSYQSYYKKTVKYILQNTSYSLIQDVLDIGSGSGGLLHAFEEQGFDASHLYGIEPSKQNCMFVQKQWNLACFKNSHFQLTKTSRKRKGTPPYSA